MKKLCWIVVAGMIVGAPGPLQAEDLHGSIAFSQDDDGAYAWGIAWSFDSSAGAQSEALGQCREYGGTRCAEAGWFQEACGALAIGDGNGYGPAGVRRRAKRSAMRWRSAGCPTTTAGSRSRAARSRRRPVERGVTKRHMTLAGTHLPL